MVKSYHVICVPLYSWEFYEIKTKDQLLSFARVLNRMFTFENIDRLKELEEENEFERKKDEIRNLSILGGHFIWKTEIYDIRDITEFVAKNLVDKFYIKRIFITDYSFEISSSNPEIISNDTIYTKLAAEISKITFKNCYNSNENTNSFEFPAIVASLKIITCDTLEEIEELTTEHNLEKVTEYLYINDYNSFNFIRTPWNKLFIPDLIVTLKPEIMAKDMTKFHQTADKFGFYVTLVHAVGKIYSISESIHGSCANIVITSWNMDEICQNLESSFSYPKRFIQNNETDFYNLYREFKEQAQPLTLLSNLTGDTIKLIKKEYGTVIGPSIEYSFDVLHHSETKKFFNDSDLIINAFMNDLKILGENLTEFLTKFQSTINSWREIYRSKINHYQMLFTIIALLVAIIGLVLTKG